METTRRLPTGTLKVFLNTMVYTLGYQVMPTHTATDIGIQITILALQLSLTAMAVLLIINKVTTMVSLALVLTMIPLGMMERLRSLEYREEPKAKGIKKLASGREVIL